jgi:hypothetical protein
VGQQHGFHRIGCDRQRVEVGADRGFASTGTTALRTDARLANFDLKCGFVLSNPGFVISACAFASASAIAPTSSTRTGSSLVSTSIAFSPILLISTPVSL